MFDGVPEQFHQFIASRTIPLPLSFSLHGSSQAFSTFDPYPSHHQTVLQEPNFLQQLHHPDTPNNQEEEREENNSLLSTNLEVERERTITEPMDPWSNDEVLALLRIRSSMENWFPDFTWEHTSRKLAELGFKRSADKCKEKFEEESRHFNNISSYGKNYNRLVFNELELYHGETSHNVLVDQKTKQGLEKPNEEEEEDNNMGQSNLEEELRFETSTVELNTCDQENEKVVVEKTQRKKRKRKEKFEILMGFCEEVVKKMIAQQEEWHNRLIEDMVKRENEKIEREEAWKKQEMETINKEIDKRAHEQAMSRTRQATIIEFLKKFTSNEDPPNSSSISLSPATSLVEPQDHKSTCHEVITTEENLEKATLEPQNPTFQIVPASSTISLDPPNPSSKNTQNNPLELTPSSTKKTPENSTFSPSDRDDIGKRWPRDEVLALINLRSSLYNNGEDKEGTKGPLWERISQGMSGLGYKRSAKRCKEKWENINKYFRKTKDVNKKRSSESRTCPYFQQLSSLYSQGTLVAPPDGPEHHSTATENHSTVPENHLGSSSLAGTSASNSQAADGDKDTIEVAGFNFEF